MRVITLGFKPNLASSPQAQPAKTPEFRDDCPCPRRGCKLHGHCLECRAKHGAKGLPRCER